METLAKRIEIKQKKEVLNAIIRERRTVFADQYIDKPIAKEVIEEIIINATWAPTHKRTEPWRFIVLEGNHKEKFGSFMLRYYKQKLALQDFPESRYESTLNYPKNATLVVIVFQRDKKERLPEWEEIAAISCAVQNMWLSCTANNIAGYWDTCEAAIAYGNNLELAENEKSLGIFYMGYPDPLAKKGKSKRKSLTKKLSWHQL